MKIKRKVNFDICTYCNHRCSFCSNSDPRTIKDQTSIEDFIQVMDNITRHVDIFELGLSAKGEVLINKDFEAIIKASKERYTIPYLYFSSNGALLNREKAIILIEAGIDSIKFSINAIDALTYENVHKVDDFDCVINNFRDLLLLKKEHYPHIKLTISSVIDMDDTALKEHFKSLFTEEFDLIDSISRYALSYTPKFDLSNSSEPITKRCSVPFQEIYINSDGTLGLCCKDYFDEINFGSLKEHDFLKLYHSHFFESIRQMHETGEFPDSHLCKKCLLFNESQDV